MKSNFKRVRRGFTLIELSIGMMIGIATGAMMLALCNQQLAFLKIYKTQNFLTDEAPVISMYVSRLIGKADRFSLHGSVYNANLETNAQLADSQVLLLSFRQSDGTMRKAILSFENRGAGSALYYYVPINGVLGDPQWAVTKAPSNVVFSMSEGVLQMTLTGPKKERITYSGTMQQ